MDYEKVLMFFLIGKWNSATDMFTIPDVNKGVIWHRTWVFVFHYEDPIPEKLFSSTYVAGVAKISLRPRFYHYLQGCLQWWAALL